MKKIKKGNILYLFQFALLGSSLSLSPYAHAAKAHFSGWKNYPEPSHILAAEREGKEDVSNYLRWKRLTTADVDINEVEAINFMRKNKGWHYWPYSSRIQYKIERSFSDNMQAQDITGFFSHKRPVTGRGWYYYLTSLEKTQKPNDFAQLVKDGWALGSFTIEMEQNFLGRYKSLLNQDDHIRRLDNLLYKGLSAEAARMYGFVPNATQKLAEARIGLRQKAPDVNARIAAIPEHVKNDKGLAYERIRWRQAEGLDQGAMDLAFESGKPHDWQSLWWRLQVKSYDYAYKAKRYKTAQKIAASHGDAEPTSSLFLEGEWLAGRAAYKVTGWEETALSHFEKLYNEAKSPIWRAKGAYWAGRTMAKAGEKELAASWFTKGSRFAHTYYGQLSANRAGISVADEIAKLQALPLQTGNAVLALPSSGQNRLANIAEILVQNGRSLEARRFAVAACPRGSGANVIKSCALWAKSIGLPDAALSMAKRLDISGDYTMMSELYPTISIPSVKNEAGHERLEKSIIHAIIRQESAFDKDVGSHAGAKGYMQLMPATAKETAGKHGLPWTDTTKLFQKDYNITLGTHYLANQVSYYKGSYILAAVAYNAGPGRANRWIKNYGDPRDKNVDAVEWVENIPIEETREYVKRVLENLVVYRILFDDQDKNESLASIMNTGGVPKRLR